MSANRRSELQRKLRATPAPEPPSGLAGRIKGEIPDPLRIDATGKPQRAASSLRLSMGIAASVLVLAVSSFILLRVLSQDQERGTRLPPASVRIPPKREPLFRQAERAQAPVPAPGADAMQGASNEVSAGGSNTAVREPEAAIAMGSRTEPAMKTTQERALPAKIAPAQKVDEEAERETIAQPAAEPALHARAAVAEGKMANAAPSAANSSAVAEAIVAPHIDAEATFAPPGNSVFVRITPAAAPDAQIEVEGGRKVADGLYAMEGNRMTIRMRYRSGGREQTLERTIVRADARTWEQTSQQTKDAVSKAKNPPE